MEIIEKRQNGTLLISVTGRMDAVTAPEFDQKLGQRLDEGITSMVFDLSKLDYISSAGLRSFLLIAKKLKANSGRIALASMQDIVKDVFEVSGFNQVLPVFHSVEEALENNK